MTQKFEFECDVDEHGNLRGLNREYFKKLISIFSGKRVLLTIKTLGKQQSDKQRKYYFGVIVPAFQYLFQEASGYSFTKQEVHDELKKRFNYVEIVSTVNGCTETIGKSTKDMDTLEREDYHDKCRQFALEFFGVEIPLPNEQSQIII